MKKFIAFIALPPPLHGQAIASQRFVARVTEAGHTCHVINTSPHSLNRRSFAYHKRRIGSYTRGIANLLISRKHSGNQIIYTVFESGLGFLYNSILLTVAKLINCKVILHHHTSFHITNTSTRFSFIEWLMKINGSHVVLSSEMKRLLIDNYGIPEERVYVLGNASLLNIKPPESCGVKPRDTSLTRIGFLGNISEEKGIAVLQNLTEHLTQKGINFELLIAGPIIDKTAENIIATLVYKYKDRVFYEGSLSQAQKITFFESLDLLVFPSKYKFEAQPLVILESLSFGVPVVTSDAGFIWELLESSDFPCVPIDNFPQATSNFIEKYNTNREKYRSDAKLLYDDILRTSLKQLETLVNIIDVR